VTAASQPSPAEPSDTADGARQDGELLDALPVLAGEPAQQPRSLRVQRVARVLTRDARPPGAGRPAVHAAAVAAGGFVAGAAVVGLVHRRQRSSAALTRGGRIGRALTRGSSRRGAPPAEVLQVVASRSLLVDVHLLGVPDGLR
jgi:hypothetical protein